MAAAGGGGAGGGAAAATDDAGAAAATTAAPLAPTVAVVHPLVMLSVTDHYNRVAKDTHNRVVGVLLGESHKGRVDISNSFAVPFDEDPKDPTIWYIDRNFLETMYGMFRKVTSKEKIVGFYSTGPKVKPADLAIDGFFRKYCAHPLLLIVDVRPSTEGLPVQAYTSLEVVNEGRETQRVFEHLTCEVGAYEAEEVCVEHLLRDINDPSVSSLGARMRARLAGLGGLEERLKLTVEYLDDVVAKKLPPNREILDNIQRMVNFLPNLGVEQLRRSLFVETNDMHLALFLGAAVRSVLALHDLTNNKMKFRDVEELEFGADSTKDAKDAKDAKDEAKRGAEEESKTGK